MQSKMIRTKDRHVEELSILDPLIKILRAYNAFPQNGKSADWKMFMKCAAPAIFVGPPIIIGLVGHIYITLKRGLWPEPIESMCFLIQILSTSAVLVAVGYNWKNFSINATRIKKYEFGVPAKCKVFARRIDFIVKLIFYGVRVIGSLYIITHYLDDSFCTKSSLFADEGYVCKVPFPLWYPLKMDTLPASLFLLLCFYVFVLYYLPILCMISLMPLTSAVLIIYRLRELKKLMTRSTEQGECKRPLKAQELKFYVEYHAEILDCVQKMNDDLGYSDLGFYIFLPVLMSLYLYKLFQEKDLSALLVMFPWFFPAALLCSVGERLQDEGYSLYITFNDIPWYIMDPKLRKIYYIFLVKLQCPICMKIKGVAEQNHLFLYKIIKGTYTFLIYLSNER